MRHTIRLPKLGDTVEDVLVTEWVARVGEELAEGATLLNAETDKVDTDVPTPVAGTLVERLVEADDEVAVGAPIAVIET